jgi:hypothetical protein
VSRTELLPSGRPVTAPAVPLLRQTLLRMADDAITYRRTERWWCAECQAESDDTLCPDHRDDDTIAADYEAARTIIASATTRGTT